MPLTSSKQPRKQRKARFNAPAHANRKLISAHLTGDLILKYNRRSVPVILGDTVKVLRGNHAGHTAKVIEIDTSRRRITIEGMTALKADGTKVPRSVDPSNLVITKVNLADPRRRDKLVQTVKGSEEERKKALKEMEQAGKEDAKALEEARQKAEEERAKARAEREAEEEEEEK